MTHPIDVLRAPFEDPDYWRGGDHGYGGEGYQDFGVNALKADEVAARVVPGARVLDVGCAFGYMVRRLRERGLDAWGTDISSYAISQAPAETRPYLIQGPAHQLWWEHETSDYLVSFGMLEHIPEDLLVPTLKEFGRIAKQGLLSITMRGDPEAEQDPTHKRLRSYQEWRQLIQEYLPGYELYSDAQEWWQTRAKRRWMVVAPTIYPVGRDGYGGIERLVVLFLRGLLKQAGKRSREGNKPWEVGCVCADGSVVPRGTSRYSSGPALQDYQEPNLIPAIASIFSETSVWLDFSHSKPVGRANEYVPQMSVIWHDPAIMQPIQPKHNVVALSEWQAERFRRIQKQDCRVLDPICADGSYFVPSGRTDRAWREYLLFIGKLAPDKGCLEAIRSCRALKHRLEIVGPVTPGDPPDYVAEVLKQCDGQDIVYHGEVTEAHKLALLQGAKALLYPVSYPPGTGEAHSHKMVEAMLCGVPCIAYDQGAMKEVIDQGVTGLVVSGREELAEAIKTCETMDRTSCRIRAIERWDYRNVVARWLPAMEEVTRGARW